MGFIQSLNSCFDFVEHVNKDKLFYTVVTFVTIMYVWETYLSLRQYLVAKNNTKVPPELTEVTDQATFEKARLYTLDKSQYSFIHELYSHIEALIFLFIGAIPYMWNLSGDQLSSFEYEWLHSEIPQSILFIFYFMIYSTITGLPWTLYFTFVLEEKHGFNKETIPFFIKDNIKKFILTLVITIPISSLLIWIVRIGGDYFFIYAWLFVTVVSLLFITIYADFIAPLFDKYTPLQEGELKTRIEELAKSLSFPLYKLYVVEGSKRSAHSNAYMYGFYKFKRIVLFDTLIKGYKPAEEKKEEKVVAEKDEAVVEKPTPILEAEALVTEKKEVEKGCTTDEILAVLAHELGHWKLNHNVKNLFLSEINTFLYFLIFAALMNRQVLYAAFGFSDEKPVFIGLIIILQFILAPYNEILSFVMTALCRRFEFQADAFAKSLNKAEFLKSSLIKLTVDNLSFPMCDWLYSAWHYSHPPLLERLRALDSKNKDE